MGEVNITYETLFELLRREKTREELQKLDESFFNDVKEYIQLKKEMLEQQKTKQDLFAAEERRKTEIQHENIRKILREIYEKREKKIVNMAIDRSRTSSSIVDSSALLKQEKDMYDYLVSLLDKFRKGVLFKLLEAESPDVDSSELAKPDEEEKEPEETPAEEGKKKIKFTHSTPKFIGDDLKEYGPYEGDDTVELPLAVAEVLIDKARAEEIE